MLDSIPSRPERYARTAALHDRITAVYSRIETVRAYRREPLVAKAINTHAAIRVLTDAQHGDDALALVRVLEENVLLLEWLLRDRVFRLELYGLSERLLHRRWST